MMTTYNVHPHIIILLSLEYNYVVFSILSVIFFAQNEAFSHNQPQLEKSALILAKIYSSVWKTMGVRAPLWCIDERHLALLLPFLEQLLLVLPALDE